MMRLEELLQVEEPVRVLESSYQHCTHITKTLRFLHNIVSELSQLREAVRARILLVQEASDTYALALYNPADGEEAASWTLLTSLLDREGQQSFRQLTDSLVQQVLPEGVETREAKRAEFVDALREYYSTRLMDASKSFQVNPEFVYNRPRVERLKTIIRELERSCDLDLSGRVLEVCCGNGMATAALQELGIEPLCLDNDPSSLVEGLAGGVLKPDKTILGDATELTDILNNEELFDAVVGFMLGDIDDFNMPMWREILLQAAAVTKIGGSLFFTLRTQPETEFVKNTLEGVAEGRVLCPDETEALYDRWVYIGARKPL